MHKIIQSNKQRWGVESGSCTTGESACPITTFHLHQPHTNLHHQEYKRWHKLITPTCPVRKAGARCFLIGQAEGDLFSDWARKGRLWPALIWLSWVFLPLLGTACWCARVVEVTTWSSKKHEWWHPPGRTWHFPLSSHEPSKPQQTNKAKADMKIKQGHLLKSNTLIC